MINVKVWKLFSLCTVAGWVYLMKNAYLYNLLFAQWGSGMFNLLVEEKGAVKIADQIFL